MGITYQYTSYKPKVPRATIELFEEMRAIDRTDLKKKLKIEQKEMIRERSKTTTGYNEIIKKGLSIAGIGVVLTAILWALKFEDAAGIVILLTMLVFFFTFVGCIPAASTQKAWVQASRERTRMLLKIHKLARKSKDFDHFQSRYYKIG